MKDKRTPKRCFVMMPLAGEFDDIYQVGIKPVVEESGYQCFRADEMAGQGLLLNQIIRSIIESDFLIVDLTDANPNVFYELGIAHTIAKPVILITRNLDHVPFDIRHFRVIVYSETHQFWKNLQQAIDGVVSSPVSSPVVEARPDVETVPKSDYVALQQEMLRLTTELEERNAELMSVKKTQGRNPELVAFRQELKDYLAHLSSDLLKTSQEQILRRELELEKLRRENESLQSAQIEVRRLKHMTLVNPHWSGRGFEVEDDLYVFF